MASGSIIQLMIDAAGSIQTIKSFLDGDDFREYLAKLDLDAAKDAISKAKIASNPDGQIWSAINHLESAHQKNSKTYSRKISTLLPGYETKQIIDAMALDMQIFCLMALCYKLLSEHLLCKQALDRVSDLQESCSEAWKFLDANYPELTYKMATIVLDPRVYVSVFKRFFLGKAPPIEVTPEQLEDLRSKLL